MNTITRGNAPEAAVVYALERADIRVLIPFGSGQGFDLAAVRPSDGGVILIQVKSGRLRDGCIDFNTCSTDHGRGRQHYRGRADVIAVHVDALDKVFMVPVEECPGFAGRLRLTPARNNQRAGIRLAENYTLAGWVRRVSGDCGGDVSPG